MLYVILTFSFVVQVTRNMRFSLWPGFGEGGGLMQTKTGCILYLFALSNVSFLRS